MKRLLCICMIFVLLFSVGCTQVSAAEKAFETAMETMKDRESLEPQLEQMLSPLTAGNKGMLQERLSRVVAESGYKVVSSEEREDGTVALQVKIKSVDASEIMNRFVQEITALVASPAYQAEVETMSKEEYHSILISVMLSALDHKISQWAQDVQVIMIKDKGGWKMQDERVITQCIFSNLAEAITSLV